MTQASYTVAANSVLGLLDYARRVGIPTEGVLAQVDLDPAALAGAEARVPHAVNNTIWALLTAASGDADFGLHFAEHIDVGTFGVVGHLLARCPSFGEGLERVVAYSRILHDAGRVELELRGGGEIVIYPGCRGLPFACPRQIAEFSAAAVVTLGRRVTGHSMIPRAVHFQHVAPVGRSEHLRVFGVAPEFGRPETALVFEAGVLRLGVLAPQVELLTYLDAYARDVVAKLPADDDVLHRIECLIAAAIGRGIPDMPSIAVQVGMSARTLQRRLAERETSFQAVVDGVRRSYAERYLSEDRLALGEIAFLLGFSDPSNFHRAFRRWTGMTPLDFRSSRRSR